MRPSALPAVEARRLIGTAELGCVELLESCLDRVESLDPVVNAMITCADDRARREAAQADEAVSRGDELGALHGIPVAIKDLQPTAGIRTTFGSPSHAENVPDEDAGIVSRIRAAGGIVIGKTNIPEFSIGANTVNPLFGATGNPFDVDLTCGGSSGGSAVAVATEMAPLATGSDHGGSLRIPACFCGVVGHRSSPGVVPHELRTTSQTFYSVQGPIARDVRDTALLLSVIAGRSGLDPMAFPLDATQLAVLDDVDPADLRIGVSEDLGGVLVSDSVRRTFRQRVDRIAPLVGSVVELDIDLRRAPEVDWRLRSDVFVSQFADQAASWGADFNPNIRQSYETALRTPMADIAAARRTQMELYQHVHERLADVDVMICPGVSISPFPWTQLNPAEIDGQPVENYMAWLALSSSLTVIGHPVTALPCGRDEQGTPFGIQVVGHMYGDRRLLSVAYALERAFADVDDLARPDAELDSLAGQTSRCRDARAV